MLMHAQKSQLLIVDMQDRLLAAMDDKDQVLDRCIRLIRAAEIMGVPVTVSEQYPKGLGPTAEALRTAFGNRAKVLEKIEFSCFQNHDIREHLAALRKKGRSQVILGGIESHICVAQTGLDLIKNGYSTFLVADAVASRAKSSRKAAFARLLHAGCTLVDSEMVLFEWLAKAGTPEFKAIQALVK